METLSIIAVAAIICGSASLLCLLALHFVSPEFEMSWRMVSEYALGRHKWLLTLFFTLWCLSSVLVAYLLWNIVTTPWATVGVVLVFISGIGAQMGGLFDMNHKLHGLAGLLGIATLPFASLLTGYHLVGIKRWSNYQTVILLSSHAVWISLVFLVVSMILLIAGCKKAGVAMGPDSEPLQTLPAGVIGINGYANRILVVCYIGWLLVIALAYLA